MAMGKFRLVPLGDAPRRDMNEERAHDMHLDLGILVTRAQQSATRAHEAGAAAEAELWRNVESAIRSARGMTRAMLHERDL